MKPNRKWLWILCFILLLLGSVLFWNQKEKRGEFGKKIEVTQEEIDLNHGDMNQVRRNKEIQKWAAQEGMTEEFTYDGFLKSLKAENEKRASIYQQGGVIYGPIEYTQLQYYNILIGEMERSLRQLYIEQADQKTLEIYYQENQESYRHVDEIECDFTIWQDEKIIYDSTVLLDKNNFRTLSESDEYLVSQMMNLSEGGENHWKGEDGREYLLVCTRRTDGGIMPLTEVYGAVKDQWAREAFEKELKLRLYGEEAVK